MHSKAEWKRQRVSEWEDRSGEILNQKGGIRSENKMSKPQGSVGHYQKI